MYITKEKFEEICKNHSSLLVLDSDVTEALEFVQELLEAEADAIKAKEPWATNSIKKLNDAAYEVFGICGDVEMEEFFEEDLEEIESRVEFRAGYHEWHALVDGKVVYAFEVDSENFDGMGMDELRDYVDECLDAVQNELRERNEKIFVPDELDNLRDMMVDAWAKHFGIEDAAVELPECVTIPARELAVNGEDFLKHYLVLEGNARREGYLANIVGDYLSDTYGYCLLGFHMEVGYGEDEEPVEVRVRDIEWDVEQELAIDEVIENANERICGHEESGKENELDL